MSVIRGSQPRDAVYVHSHFQHFQRTIEDNSLIKKTDRISKKIAKAIDAELVLQIKIVSKEELRILKAGYGSDQKGDLRKFYKEEIKKAFGPNTLAGMFVSHRSDKLSQAGLQETIKAGLIAVNSDKKVSEKEFIKKERVKFEAFLNNLSKAVSDLYEGLEKGYKDQDLHNLAGLPGMVARAQAAIGLTFDAYLTKKNAPTAAINNVKASVKKLSKVRSINGYNTQVGKIFHHVSETIFEMILGFSAFAAGLHGHNGIVKTFEESIATGLFKRVGAVGGSNKPIGTTDIQFKLGKVVIGWDVKSNKEVYTKTQFSAGGSALEVMENMITKHSEFEIFNKMGINSQTFFKWLMYAIVNSAAIKASLKSTGAPETSTDYEEGWVEKNVIGSFTKILLLAGFIDFLDKYLANFKNQERSQIIISFGTEVIFLSEFLRELRAAIIPFINNPKNNLYAKIGSIHVTPNLKDLNSQVVGVDQLWNSKKEVIVNEGLKDSTNRARGYPTLFKSMKGTFGTITKSVLGSSFQVGLSFNFDVRNLGKGIK